MPATGAKAGVLLTPVFVNSTAGATYMATNGQWLDSPDAALIGDVDNSNSNEAVLLSLGSPTYDAAAKVLPAALWRGWPMPLHVPPVQTLACPANLTDIAGGALLIGSFEGCPLPLSEQACQGEHR